MSFLFRNGPRRRWAAWPLVILCWLSISTAAAGLRPEKISARPAAQYVIRRAEITLEVADAERTGSALEELARTVRGHLDDETLRFSSSRREVKADLVLPPEMLGTALVRLRGMALTVLSEKVENNDVSNQVSELNRQLEQLEVAQGHLQSLLERAATDSEQRQVQTSLSQTEAEMSELEARLVVLRQEADWAVIAILALETVPTPTPLPTLTPSLTPTVTPIPATPSPTPWQPSETVQQATSVLVSILQDLSDVLIVLAIVGGPFLALVLGGWWMAGRVRKS
jgi:hypothetical protein